MDERISAGRTPSDPPLPDSIQHSSTDIDRPGAAVPTLFGCLVGAMMGYLLGLAMFELATPLPPRPSPKFSPETLEALGLKEQPPPPPAPPQDRPLWPWTAAGGGIGALLGMVIGWLKWVYDAPTNIGTTIGLVFGLLPAVLILFAGAQMVRGAFSFFLIIGLMGVVSAVGMLLGGFADRLYDRYLLPARKPPTLD